MEYNTELTNEGITSRFIFALYEAKRLHLIKGIKNWCEEYGVDRRNLYKLQSDPSRKIFSPEWVSFMMRDHRLNPNFIFLAKLPVYLTADNRQEMIFRKVVVY